MPGFTGAYRMHVTWDHDVGDIFEVFLATGARLDRPCGSCNEPVFEDNYTGRSWTPELATWFPEASESERGDPLCDACWHQFSGSMTDDECDIFLGGR